MKKTFKEGKLSSKGEFVKESDWTVNAETMQLDLKFKVCSETKDETVLVTGERFPFVISLSKKGENYALKTALSIKSTRLNASSSKLETKGLQKVSCETDFCVSQDKWYVASLVICDSEFDLFVDGNLKARRVFSGDVCISSKNQETVMKFGGKNFDGYVESCETYDAIQGVSLLMIETADEVGYMEIESRIEDLKLEGKDLGQAISYETKYDVSDYTSEPRVVEYEYGVICWSHEGQAVYCGKELYGYYLNNVKKEEQSYPIVDEKQCEIGSYILFPNELVYRNGSSYTILRGAIYHRYVDEGLENSVLGYPNTDYDNYSSHKDISYFQNGVILCFKDNASGEFTSVMDYDMYSHYNANREKLGDAGPVTIERSKYFSKDSESVVTIGSDNLGFLYKTIKKIDVLRCKEGDLYRITFLIGFYFLKTEKVEYYYLYGDIAQTYRDMGDVESKLSFPVSSHICKGTGTEFCDFDNGVISKRNGVLKSYTPMSLHLVQVTVKKIDDGTDSNPELKAYAYWTVGNDSEKQIYSCGKGKKADSTFNFAKHDTSSNAGKIRFIPSGENNIKVRVHVEDWDRVTKNDKIGEFIFDLNVENDWKIGDNVMYFTNEGADNRGGLENGELSYAVFDIYKENAIRENPVVRRDYYWKFSNFGNDEKIKYPDYAKTFGISEHNSWFDYVLHPLDSIWYKTCIEECGTGGNCFGLTVEAIHSILGYSLYHPSLSDYLPNPTFDCSHDTYYSDFQGEKGKKLLNTINCKHLYQNGAAVIEKKLATGIIYNSTKENFETIIDCINKDGYVLISLNGIQDGEFFGHAVLGYKVGKDGNNKDIIYTADSNCHYGKYSNEDCTILRYKGEKNVECRYLEGDKEVYPGLKLGLVTAIPMSVCLKYPKVPNLAVMIAWGLYNLDRKIFLNLDCCCKSIVRDGEELFSSGKGILSNDVIPLTSAEGKLFAIIKGNTENLNIKLFGKKSGRKNKISLINKSGAYVVETDEEEGVEDAVVFTKLEKRIPGIELKSEVKKKFGINITSTRKVGKEYQTYTGKHQLLKTSVKIQENPFARRLEFVEDDYIHFKKAKRLVFSSKRRKEEKEVPYKKALKDIKIKDLLPKYTSKKYVRPKKVRGRRLFYSKIRIVKVKRF